MIKYLGSKRRLVPALGAVAAVAAGDGAGTALDLFTGTTRVAQELKRRGLHTTAVDRTRAAHVLACTYVATDAATVDRARLEAAVAELDALPGVDGYATDVFCRQARYFHPRNGARIDAVRAAIADRWAGTDLEPLLLTSLLEAADRVDSTTGVQMAYLKAWAPRAHNELRLRVPELVVGPGRAIRGDAAEVVASLPAVDLAYLDPPYNQHRYESNYHVWETLVAWDAPDHYGVACKRVDLRDPAGRSAFNSRRTMPAALRQLVAAVDARLLVLSYNDEAWLTLPELLELAGAGRPHVRGVAVRSRRYVGAQIGIHDPAGRKVGTVSHLGNREYLVLSGPVELVERAAAAAVAALPEGAAELVDQGNRRRWGRTEPSQA